MDERIEQVLREAAGTVETAIGLFGSTNARRRRAQHDRHPGSAVALPGSVDRAQELILVQPEPCQPVVTAIPGPQFLWKRFVLDTLHPSDIGVDRLGTEVIAGQAAGARTKCGKRCRVAASGCRGRSESADTQSRNGRRGTVAVQVGYCFCHAA